MPLHSDPSMKPVHALVLLSLLLSCGEAPAPVPTASLRGTVETASRGGFDLIRGARVQVRGGPVAITDDRGRFRLDGLPAGPVVLEIRGPDDGVARGSQLLELTLEPGAVETVAARLLPGCVRNLSASKGGELVIDGCGDGGRVKLEFPPDAFVDDDGAPFRGAVTLHVFPIDPVVPEHWAAVQNAGDGEAFGGVEVVLESREGGRPLQLAQGTDAIVTVDLGPSDRDVPEKGLMATVLDPSTGEWTPVDRGERIELGGRWWYRFRAPHFSSYTVRPVTRVESTHSACVFVEATLPACSSGACAPPAGVILEIFGSGRKTTHRRTTLPAPCVLLDQRLDHRIELTWIDPASDELWTERIHLRAWSGATTRECRSDCLDLGRIVLAPSKTECVSVELWKTCGHDCSEPITGPVQALQHDRVIATLEVPEGCGGELCVPLPLVQGSEVETVFRDPLGREAVLSLGATGAPPSCSAGAVMCSADPACHAAGSLVLGCDREEGCVEPDFRHHVRQSAACPADALELELDASPSRGDVPGFEWRLWPIDASGNSAPAIFTAHAWPSDPIVRTCVKRGRYRASLSIAVMGRRTSVAVRQIEVDRPSPSGLDSRQISISGGAFVMGCDPSRERCDPDRRDLAHAVTLSPFSIDRHEVTQGEYAACVAAGRCTVPDSSQERGCFDTYSPERWPEKPVVCVTWEQAETHCRWRGLELPTEAQWEHAARGHDQRIYPWGDTPDLVCARANHRSYTPGTGCLGERLPVGRLPEGASPFGVEDLAGNVSEWVRDVFSPYPAGPELDPVGPPAGATRVVRGGGFHSSEDEVRSSVRTEERPEHTSPALGFRCAG